MLSVLVVDRVMNIDMGILKMAFFFVESGLTFHGERP